MSSAVTPCRPGISTSKTTSGKRVREREDESFCDHLFAQPHFQTSASKKRAVIGRRNPAAAEKKKGSNFALRLANCKSNSVAAAVDSLFDESEEDDQEGVDSGIVGQRLIFSKEDAHEKKIEQPRDCPIELCVSNAPAFKPSQRLLSVSTDSNSNSPRLTRDAYLPETYKIIILQWRLLEDLLPLYRQRKQIPYFVALKPNIEASSGKRVTLARLRQIVFASDGLLSLHWLREASCSTFLQCDIPHWQRYLIVAQKMVDTNSSVFGRLPPGEDRIRQNIVESKLRALKPQRHEDDWPSVPLVDLHSNPHCENSSTRKDEEIVRPNSGLSDVLQLATPNNKTLLQDAGASVRKNNLRKQLRLTRSPLVTSHTPLLLSHPKSLISGEDEANPATPCKNKAKNSSTPSSRIEGMRGRLRERELRHKGLEASHEESLKFRKNICLAKQNIALLSELSILFFQRKHPSMHREAVCDHLRKSSSILRNVSNEQFFDMLKIMAEKSEGWIEIRKSDYKENLCVVTCNRKIKTVSKLMTLLQSQVRLLEDEFDKWNIELSRIENDDRKPVTVQAAGTKD